MNRIFQLAFTTLIFSACTNSGTQIESTSQAKFNEITITSAMRNVMWKGELAEKIHLDTISNKEGLMGIGPMAYLKGEITICDGEAYISRVLTDSTMIVEKTYDVGAPFFVHYNVKEWEAQSLPDSIKNIAQLEAFIVEVSQGMPAPFAFKLEGEIASGIIHIQNLADGSVVTSPQEAHAGQTNYKLGHEAAKVVGFYSQEHKAVFTHHDTFLHLHLITSDEKKMGHLDEVEFEAMTLYLPKFES